MSAEGRAVPVSSLRCGWQERGLSKKEILMVRDYMDQEKDNRIALEELEVGL